MFWIFSSSVQKKTISKVAATSTTAQPIPTQTRQQPQQQQTTSQTKEKEIKQSHRQPKTATAAIVRNSDQSSDIEMDPEQNAVDCVRFKFERICHAIDGTNGKERLKKVIEIDEKVKEMIGKKFEHFTFEKMYNHGLKFMSGGVNKRFHVIPSNASPRDTDNDIDIYMLRKTEAFPPKEPYIGECVNGHDNRQRSRIQIIRANLLNVSERIIKSWLEQNGANLRSRHITLEVSEANRTKRRKENHSKFLEGCLLRLLCFHFKDEMMPINQSGSSVVGPLPLVLSRYTRDDFDIMSVGVVLLSNFLHPASLTKYQTEYRTRTVQTPKRFQCTLCPLLFAWPQGLRNHITLQHRAKKPALPVPAPKRFHCEPCDVGFADRETMMKHMYVKHNVTPPHKTDKWLNIHRPFKCKQCTKTYARRSSLKKHVENIHRCSYRK